MAYEADEVVGHVAGALGTIVGAAMQGAAIARQRQLQNAADCRAARARVRSAANAFNVGQTAGAVDGRAWTTPRTSKSA